MLKRIINYVYSMVSPVKYARRIGVNLGKNCLIYRSMEWPTEPYLITIGDNVQLILDNDADIKIISITNSEVHIRKEVDSMFGSIIGIKKYSLDSIYNGYVDSNNKIRIKKG